MTDSITINGNTVTEAQLTDASIKDLVDTYNGLMEQTGGKAIKKFKDKATAVKRVWAAATKVAEAEAPDAGDDETEVPGASEPKKAKAKAETPKERKAREKHFVFPFDEELYKQRGTPRKDSLRDKALRKLNRKTGASLTEIETLVNEFDAGRGKAPFNVERRAYELVRLVHYYMGYGLSQDGNRIHAHTGS